MNHLAMIGDKKIIDHIKQMIDAVPLGNSKFQMDEFYSFYGCNKRKVRHYILQIESRLTALKVTKYKRQMTEIEVEELQAKLAKPNLDSFKERKLKLKLAQKMEDLQDQVKLIEDAIHIVKDCYNQIKDVPAFTREEFEAEEVLYWQKRTVSDAEHELATLGHIEKGTLQQLTQLKIQAQRKVTPDGQAYIEFVKPTAAQLEMIK